MRKQKVMKQLGISKQDYAHYTQELEETGLISFIIQARADYNNKNKGKLTRGKDYHFGGMGEQESIDLYCIVRALKPNIIVETGVCNGVSSTVILKALEKNNNGKLISIDLPEIEGVVYKDGDFWKNKGGTIIEKEKQPGWMVPDELRGRWEFLIGRSQDILPELMEKQKSIDIFIHDSEHSYDCMSFEYKTAYPNIKKDGLLISDDIFANTAFNDFCDTTSSRKLFLNHSVGILVK